MALACDEVDRPRRGRAKTPAAGRSALSLSASTPLLKPMVCRRNDLPPSPKISFPNLTPHGNQDTRVILYSLVIIERLVVKFQRSWPFPPGFLAASLNGCCVRQGIATDWRIAKTSCHRFCRVEVQFVRLRSAGAKLTHVLSVAVAVLIAAGHLAPSVAQTDETRFSDILLPFTCTSSSQGISVQPSEPTYYRVIGLPRVRTLRSCADTPSGRCEDFSIRAYSFEVACENSVVQWRQIAEQATNLLGGGARFYNGYLQFQFEGRLSPWTAGDCPKDGWPPEGSTGARPSSKFPDVGCSQVGSFDKSKWFIEFPNGFAPLHELGVRTLTSAEKQVVGVPALPSPGPRVDAARNATETGETDERPGAEDRPGSAGEPEGGAPTSAEPPVTGSPGPDTPPDTPQTAAPEPDARSAGGQTASTTDAEPGSDTASQVASSDSRVADETGQNSVGQLSETATPGSIEAYFRTERWMGLNIIDIALRVLSGIVILGMSAAIILSLIYRPKRDKIADAVPGFEDLDFESAAGDIRKDLLNSADDLIRQVDHRLSGLKNTASLRKTLVREIEAIKHRIHSLADIQPTTDRERQHFHSELERCSLDLLRIQDTLKTIQASLANQDSENNVPQTIVEALEVLGANENTNVGTLKRLVDALRATWHPDLAVDEIDRAFREERLKQINVAWDIINGKRAEA